MKTNTVIYLTNDRTVIVVVNNDGFIWTWSQNYGKVILPSHIVPLTLLTEGHIKDRLAALKQCPMFYRNGNDEKSVSALV